MVRFHLNATRVCKSRINTLAIATCWLCLIQFDSDQTCMMTRNSSISQRSWISNSIRKYRLGLIQRCSNQSCRMRLLSYSLAMMLRHSSSNIINMLLKRVPGETIHRTTQLDFTNLWAFKWTLTSKDLSWRDRPMNFWLIWVMLVVL